MINNRDLAGRIIVALDVGDKEEAFSLVRELEFAKTFKVGLKLFTAEGPSFLRVLRAKGKDVFLDLKLHDIPNTVSETVKVCTRYGARLMTLHASGGREMMSRAADAARSEAENQRLPKPGLLAVTVLTSLNDRSIQEIGISTDTKEQVIKLAKLAEESGMDGVVCSPWEIEIVKKETGQDFLVVSPGIRPAWSAAHDQKRIMTPSQAIEKGADYIVIGRPIIAAPSPSEAFDKIVREIKGQ